MKHFISLTDLTLKDFREIFQLTEELRNNPQRFNQVLGGKFIGLLFEKPSLRTRVSFEVGINQLGGKAIYLSSQEVQLGKRESIGDVAKTLSKYLQGVILRTFSHQSILEFAKNSQILVINGLTDLLHPVQVLSDFYTIYKRKKDLKAIKICFVGDGNNVCNSLILGSAKLGLNLWVASPLGFEPDKDVIKKALQIVKKTRAKIRILNNPELAVKSADVLYTDVWTSMGKEEERTWRREVFEEFRVDKDLLRLAKKNCLVMHCLPAQRGEEISSEILDSKNSIVFEQAENRLYVQKALLVWLFRR
ncbi:MAG TPA: ornithine carbamoyltransferase [Candidatus Omnitrophica bacterium]|nr:MAG: ornithine carbamoyltransferase [Candidatus Omnitrophota bacterium]RKY44887.1 MAG: ornithine carbamoyltransferase [Candidatus Omnitrophota bacterium]HEC69327.1 ornithine carbamoyltransferase [Candidatus Omnitrophota bacterium]